MGYENSAEYYDLFGDKPDIDYYTNLGVQHIKHLWGDFSRSDTITDLLVVEAVKSKV